MKQTKFLRSCLVGGLFLLQLVNAGFSQELDMDCRPILLPTQCNSIAIQIDTKEREIKAEIRDLQEELRSAVGNEKVAIAAQIKRKQRELADDPQLKALRTSLAACRQQFDTTPRRIVAANVLNANFSGTVTNTTSSGSAPGPFSRAVNIGMQFSQNRCNVTITNFPSITFDTPPLSVIGIVTTTITKTGGGSGNFFPVTGQMLMPLTLLYTYSVPLLASPDTAGMALTTGTATSRGGSIMLTGASFTSSSSGRPVDDCGKVVNGTPVTCTITLVGSTIYQNGFLSGNFGEYTATGTLTVPQPGTATQCTAKCEADYAVCVSEADPGRAGATIRARCIRERTACRNSCSP